MIEIISASTASAGFREPVTSAIPVRCSKLNKKWVYISNKNVVHYFRSGTLV